MTEAEEQNMWARLVALEKKVKTLETLLAEDEGRAIPPTLTPTDHVLNICTIAAGLIISPQNPVGTLGEDAMLVYHKVIDAYLADPEMPQ
jgi:hypothetical protein